LELVHGGLLVWWLAGCDVRERPILSLQCRSGWRFRQFKITH